LGASVKTQKGPVDKGKNGYGMGKGSRRGRPRHVDKPSEWGGCGKKDVFDCRSAGSDGGKKKQKH